MFEHFVEDGAKAKAGKSITANAAMLLLRLVLEHQSRRRRQTPLSGGRVESLCKGLSGMDAARAVMGQGRPFVGGPHPVVPLEQ